MFSWLGGGYVNSQYMSIYFWYTCMLPGLIALMCSLSNKKEKQFTSYYIKISLPINLKKFWISKNIIIALKSIIATIILVFCVEIIYINATNFAVFTPIELIVSSIIITITSFWQIPICLILARKTNFFISVFLNIFLQMFSPILMQNTILSFLFPYCWATKIAQPLTGIEVNGTISPKNLFPFSTIPIIIILSISLLIILLVISSRWFSKQQGV